MLTLRAICLGLLTAILLCAQESADSPAQEAIRLIQSGRSSDAVKLLARAVKQFETDVNLWNLLGIAETESGDFKSARDSFEHGLKLAPGSPDLNENIGLLFFRQADYANAKKYLRVARSLGSSKPGVLFSLAAAKLRTGEPGDALTELRSLEPALSGKSDYWEERGRAELLIDSRSAPNSFERALALNPDSAVILNEAAVAAEKQGLDEKALAYLIRARTLAPNDVPTLMHFASVCIRRDLGPDAREALKRAQELDPSNNTVLYLLARATISLQNWQEAYDLFDQFSKRVPNYAPAHYAMGWLDIRLNRLEDARRELGRALALDPRLFGAGYELARLEFDDGQLDKAKRLLLQVLARDPKNAPANVTLGEILMRNGSLDEAQRRLETATEQDPKLASAHYQLSVLFFRKHDAERAAKERDIATNLNEEAKRASKTQLRLILPDSDKVP